MPEEVGLKNVGENFLEVLLQSLWEIFTLGLLFHPCGSVEPVLGIGKDSGLGVLAQDYQGLPVPVPPNP
jgi:hypothetical protein